MFVSGALAFLISLSPARAYLINAIPKSLKLAIAAGIGFFLALIGFENAGAVQASPVTFVEAGDFSSPRLWIAASAFVLIGALAARNIRGAVLIGILAATAAAAAMGLTMFTGIASAPPSLAPTFLQMDVLGALALGPLMIVFVFLMVDLLDTSGTITAVAHQAGLLDENGHLPDARRALVADCSASMIGAALGTSSTTSYIESAAGVEAGGRSGLTAVVVAALFAAKLAVG